MKFFHTADWHLGKLVQGVYMTEDQRYILNEFIRTIEEEKPDAIVIAGDLYDRGVPPTDAVDLLDAVLEEITIKLKTPVLAIAGNHDSPSRLDFASKIMKANDCHIVGHISDSTTPVIINDQYGEVHFHLVPYADPSMVRTAYQDEEIKSHNDAMKKIVGSIEEKMTRDARHVFVGHAFVTPRGEEKENTSDSERPLAIGGAEHVDASLFSKFHYTALGHLHQAHFVGNETIRYAGSPLKYSISEERHKKGFNIVEIDSDGTTTVEKRLLIPKREMRTVEAKMEDLLKYDTSEDYVFVRLLDETPVLSPMEKIRSVYPNAMHVERDMQLISTGADTQAGASVARHKMDDLSLFKAFYKEVKGTDVSKETESIFIEVLEEQMADDNERGNFASNEVAATKETEELG